MAKVDKEKKSRKLAIKKPATLREQVQKDQNTKPKQRRIRAGARRVAKPLKTAANVGKKEYYLPLPDNKAGRFLNKRRRVTPRYFKEAWQELKLVTWPNRKETTKLTIAVIIFAIGFGITVAIVDYGLDKIFRSLLLK